MSLTPLLDAFSADPVVAQGRRDRRARGDAPLVDVAVEPGAPGPPLLAALGRGRRHPAAGGDGHRPRGRGPRRRPALLPARRPGRRLPVLGDPAARAAQPPQRHRRPAARRAAPADPPRPRRPGVRPARRRGRARCARCCSRWSRGSASWRRCALRAGDERPLERRRRGARGGGLHPHRPGRAARRVRRARRHPRRLPADRGAPGPGRVLGRHGRGDPLVQGRRPAQPRGRRARSLGAALPRDPAHRRRSASARRGARRPAARRRPTCSARSPRASPSRAWSRSPRPSSTAWSACSTSCAPAPTSSCCDPERVRTRAHDLVATSAEFLEASWANAAAGNAVPVDLQGGARHRVVLDPGRAPRRTPLTTGRPGGR